MDWSITIFEGKPFAIKDGLVIIMKKNQSLSEGRFLAIKSDVMVYLQQDEVAIVLTPKGGVG